MNPRHQRSSAPPAWRAAFVAALLLWPAGARAASGELDTFPVRGWSPNGDWLAFNWPDQNDLFFISMSTGRSYSLKPVGSDELDVAGVVSPGAPTEQALQRGQWALHVVPSPGQSKLTLVEWSPDSRMAAYLSDRDTVRIFSVEQGAIIGKARRGSAYPWTRVDELRFDLGLRRDNVCTNCYSIRLLRPDNSTAKEIVFTDPRETRQMSVVRYRQADVLSHNHQFLVYPRATADGWVLMREPVAGATAPPKPLGPARLHAPYEWRLSADDRWLAVADNDALQVGPIDDWSKARSLSLRFLSITLAWSPDGRYIAYNDKQNLHVLGRDSMESRLVSKSCAARFWGWRGTALLFGDARTDVTNVFAYDPDEAREPEQLIKARRWDTAPRLATLSPHGARLACVVTKFDSEGRPVPQLWQYVLPQGDWRTYTNKLARAVGEGVVIEAKPVELPRFEPKWEMLYALPPPRIQ